MPAATRRKAMRALPLAALALLATLVPGAAAQAAYCGALSQPCQAMIQLSIAPPDLLVPEAPMASTPMAVTYAYSPLPMSFAPTRVQLAVTQFPPWVHATVAPSTLYMQVQPVPTGLSMQSSPEAHAFLLLGASGEAPAFTEGILEVVATAEPNGALMASRTTVQVPVAAAYWGALELDTPAPAVALQPRDGGFVPLRVTNLGNAVTRVTFEVAEAPRGVRVVLPGELTLPSRFDGRETSRTLVFGLEAPGSYAPGEVVLTATPAFAADPSWVGEAARLVITVAPPGAAEDMGVRVLGGGAPDAVEPLTWGLLAAGAAGVALLERARRRRSH